MAFSQNKHGTDREPQNKTPNNTQNTKQTTIMQAKTQNNTQYIARQNKNHERKKIH